MSGGRMQVSDSNNAAVAQAWEEGYRAGINDERISESNIDIAGFGAKLQPARANPYGAAPAPVARPVATVSECEACFTPDVCQLRGTCDHYAAEQLRVAPAAPAPVAPRFGSVDLLIEALDWCVAEINRDSPACVNGRAVLEAVKGVPAPVTQPLTCEQIVKIAVECHRVSPSEFYFARAIERAHGIGDAP